MGEIADAMLDGTLCEGCGVYMGDECGYPVRCDVCGPADDDNLPISSRAQTHANPLKTNCSVCGKRVKRVGLKDHMRVVHSGVAK
jgi:hypothetical protein